MSIFTRIAAFFMSLIVSFGGLFQFFLPKIPEARTEAELLQLESRFEKHELSDTLYVVDPSQIKSVEFDALRCLQGLANRDKAQIFISNCWMARQFLKQIESKGITLCYNDESGKPWNLKSLIEKFKGCISDSGYVLYRYSEFAEGFNTACNYATVKGWLAISTELQSFAEECGLRLKKDISQDEYDFAFLEKFFDEYKDEFSDAGIVHIRADSAGLRDFAIQQKMFICYTDPSTEGKRFLKKVLNTTGKNGIVMGWCENEKHFVEFISKLGFCISPSDHSYNLSVMNGFDSDFTVPDKQKKITPDPSKHYVALIYSDGDNIQWMTNGVSEYYRHLALERDYPVTWGFPCMCESVCSAVTKEIYSAADGNTSFIAGPSGIGYAMPSAFEEKSMDAYTTETAAAMLKSGMRIVNIIDDEPLAIKTAAFARKFDYYSRFSNIDGGIIFLDPRMYGAGEGRVWFSNGKPFLTVRKTLWSTDGYDGINDQWMKEQADEINSYKADINSINGYSAICIHAWSLTPENLQKLVAMFDEHIELVSAEQLIDMITENVPHKYAKPE